MTFHCMPASGKIIRMSALNKIFEGLIEPQQGDFSESLAQHVLGIAFSEDQVARYQELAAKNGEGPMGADEKAELEAFVTANTFLMVLKSKARRSLAQHAPAA